MKNITEIEINPYEVLDWLKRNPAEVLEGAYQHIARNRQRAPGRYDVGDLMALIVLDQLQQTFNVYPFAAERRPS